MENLKAKRNEMIKQNHYKQVSYDIKALMKKGIVQKEITKDITGYQKIDNKDLVYKLEYFLYENDTQSSYAYITKNTTGDPSEDANDEYSIYELDYSDVHLVRELVDATNIVGSKNSDTLINLLNIIGWVIIVVGTLLGLMAAEEGIQFFLLGIMGAVTTGVVFFALASIIKHLQSIDSKLSKETKDE